MIQTRTTLTQQPVAAGATVIYRGQFLDDAGNPIPAAALQSLTLSIVDTKSGAIVNGASAVNILNAGRGAVDNLGNLTLVLSPLDTALANAGDLSEERSLVLDWTYLGGVRTGRHQVDFTLIALAGP
jgi:hypothetical protein